MKTKTPTRPVLTLFALVLMLGGCASSSPTSTVAQPEPVPVQHIEYVVQRGDRLSEIAQTFTGDVSNWRAIAAANNIKNPRNLREGAVLIIPQSLLQIPEATVVAEAPQQRSLPRQEPQRQATQITPPLGVQRTNPISDSEVVVTAIPKKSEFELNPLQQDSSGRLAAGNVPGQSIKVVGSYYPKGIYSAPKTSSRLLMRVTPGTAFQLEATIDGWFKITTDQGSGFIRHSDATVNTD